MRNLCRSSMREKSDWKADGYFKLLEATQYVYMYHHSSHHAACSSVKYSHLEFVYSVDEEYKYLEDGSSCNRPNLYHLAPFFMDNRGLTR